jgi:NADPH:quinone reductase-like Zn-dependent oxidoreductase
VFLAFLFFAVQLLFNLYATSVVTSTAYEGARLVAGHESDHADPNAVNRARGHAEARMRELLGEYGERVTFDWSASTADTVSLRVHARNPNLTFGGLGNRVGFGEVDRTVSIRVEQPR